MNLINIEDHITYKSKQVLMDTFTIYTDVTIKKRIDTGISFTDEGIRFKQCITIKDKSFIHFFDKDNNLVLEIENCIENPKKSDDYMGVNG